MVFISVSTHPGSWRLAAFRPVFGSVFAFRPLNEEYCIPDTVYTTSAFVRSRRNFFFRQMETTQQSCCNAAKRAHECAPRASPAGWASGPETPTYPIDLREIQPRPKPDLTTSIEVSLGVDPSGDFADRSVPTANHDGDIVAQAPDARRIPKRRLQGFLPRRKPSHSDATTATVADRPMGFLPINDIGDLSYHVILPKTVYFMLLSGMIRRTSPDHFDPDQD
jgi:hypothetical protein